MSALEISQILPETSVEREKLQSMAVDIISYVSNDLRSPEGAFYSAEDADSYPDHGATIKKEGAFYVWTASKIQTVLGDEAEVFNYIFGVKQGGNCDPKHDLQGELEGKVRIFEVTKLQM